MTPSPLEGGGREEIARGDFSPTESSARSCASKCDLALQGEESVFRNRPPFVIPGERCATTSALASPLEGTLRNSAFVIRFHPDGGAIRDERPA